MSRRFNIDRKNNIEMQKNSKYNNFATQKTGNSDDTSEENNVNNQVPNSNITTTIKDSNIDKTIKAEIKMPKKAKIGIILTLATVLAFLLLLIYVTVIIDYSDNMNNGLATSGYYAMRCPEVTVIFVDKANGYTQTGSATYPFEDYIAGVIRGEVLSLNNIEIYKEFAILARTYFLTHDDGICTIEASDRKQVFRTIEERPYYAEKVKEAIEATKGQVLLENNELRSVAYDAFCSIAVDNNYYTIKQRNQKIPRSWVDSQPGIAESWKQGDCSGNHGNGVSTWGSYYLTTTQGYKYDQLLKYYLGDNITISTGGFMSSIDGLMIKNTAGAAPLNTNLSSALSSKGSSISELNNYIKTNVKNNGAGTRAGVVTAAVSLINGIYDTTGMKIPYYWNGKYTSIGVKPSFGGYRSPSEHGETKDGFDCSGFVSWAIINGGYNFPGASTREFEKYSYGDNCYINSQSCIGQPGDLINCYNCHVQMIVAVDEQKGVYYIAESGGGTGGVTMHSAPMHTASCGANTKILHMDKYYNNSANINKNY